MKYQDYLRSTSWTMVPFCLLWVCPSLALAHTGVGTSHGLGAGIAHPVVGWDHLCAMIAVGLWAAQRGGRALWIVPFAFVGVMAVGGLMGLASAPLPYVEQGIAVSVLVLGLLVATSARLPLVASALLVGVFALFHGHAHGTEIPATASGLYYAIGFLLSTAALHAVGIGAGLAITRVPRLPVVRIAGAAMAVFGLILCLM